jgi:3-deoxy-D-manno-octulosonate 8-phosphate phosphatase (KDO 8-P phosphatase)
MENFKQMLRNVSCFVLDVDGVLTDGMLLLLPDGEQLRKMYIRDGYAMQLAIKKGYHVVIISGGKSEAVRKRLEFLGVKNVYLGAEDKESVIQSVIKNHGLAKENILYMGDDIPDLPALKHCGVAVCPADAAPEIKSSCIYVSDKPGGHGCVRDVIEQTMRLQNKW